MIKVYLTTPHEILKRSLCKNEDIFIYDELHGVSVIVENINGKKFTVY